MHVHGCSIDTIKYVSLEWWSNVVYSVSLQTNVRACCHSLLELNSRYSLISPFILITCSSPSALCYSFFFYWHFMLITYIDTVYFQNKLECSHETTKVYDNNITYITIHYTCKYNTCEGYTCAQRWEPRFLFIRVTMEYSKLYNTGNRLECVDITVRDTQVIKYCCFVTSLCLWSCQFLW